MAQNFTILQGKTFSQVIRWETKPIVYKAITAITKAAPARITATAHGIPDGWRVAIVSAKGMTQINAKNTPPKDSDFTPSTFVDANTIELNSVNAADYTAYTSGGYVQYNTPKSLTGFTARMAIKDRVGGTVLLALDSTVNNRIAIDQTTFTITLTVSATDTAAITWTDGVYDLEMVDPAGVVSQLLSGAIKVVKEVTT